MSGYISVVSLNFFHCRERQQITSKGNVNYRKTMLGLCFSEKLCVAQNCVLNVLWCTRWRVEVPQSLMESSKGSWHNNRWTLSDFLKHLMLLCREQFSLCYGRIQTVPMHCYLWIVLAKLAGASCDISAPPLTHHIDPKGAGLHSVYLWHHIGI